MPVINVVNRFRLSGALRIEAEYYQPVYLEIEAKLKSLKSVAFGKYCDFVKKGIFDLPPSNYTEEGITLIRTTEIKSHIANLTSAVKISEETHQRNLNTQLTAGDLVFTKIGAYIGDVAILPTSAEFYNFSQNVAGAKIKRDLISPRYLAGFFASRYGRSQLNRAQMLSGQGKLELIDIKHILIPPASQSFQKAVGEIYLSAENKILSSKDLYNQAEKLLLAELGLLDWKPKHTRSFVRRYSEATQARRVDAEYFQPKYEILRQHIRQYANGFCRLTDIATNSQEVTNPKSAPEQDFNYVELSNVNQSNGVIESANEVKGKDAPSRARMVLRQGDVIASSVEGSLDKVALVNQDFDGAVGSTGFFVLRPKTIESGYLLALVKSLIVREQMRCQASGTILTAVSPLALSKIIVPQIPKTLHAEISDLIIQSHEARREANRLLQLAKHAVEIAIEQDEQTALTLIDENTKNEN